MTKEFTARSIGIVAAASVGLFVSVGPIIASTFGLFMASFGETYGISRTAFSSVILVTTLLGALGTPIAGRAMDRYGVRAVVLPGVFCFGLAMMGVSLVEGEMWQLYLAYAVIGVFAGIQNTVAYSKLLSMWFRANRGKVLAIMSTAAGISYAVMPQVTRAVIAAEGWRAAYLTLGGLILAALLVLVPFLRMPEAAQAGAGHHHAGAEGETPAEASRTGLFWALVALLFLAVFSLVGTVAHVFPMMLDRNLGAATAATTLSLFAVGTICGQLTYGFVLDHFSTPKVVIPYFVVGLIGMTMVHRLNDVALVMPGAFLMGIGQGAELGLTAYLVGRYFGTRHFGEIYGYIFAGATVASGVGPVFFGISFDRLGGYGPIMLFSELALATVVLIAMLLPPYRYAKAHAAPPAAKPDEAAAAAA